MCAWSHRTIWQKALAVFNIYLFIYLFSDLLKLHNFCEERYIDVVPALRYVMFAA